MIYFLAPILSAIATLLLAKVVTKGLGGSCGTGIIIPTIIRLIITFIVCNVVFGFTISYFL